ncbi:hypothetical protein OAM98_03775 [Schleiferiaceae bacterium]|nr:hypothetical protein [Schleiferiaceae bacterium]
MEILRIIKNNPGTKFRIGLLDNYDSIKIKVDKVPNGFFPRLFFVFYIELTYTWIYLRYRNKVLIQNKVSTPYPFSIIFAKRLIIDLDDMLKVNSEYLKQRIIRKCHIVAGTDHIANYYSTNGDWVINTPAFSTSSPQTIRSECDNKFLLWVVQSGGLKYLTDEHLDVIKKSGFKLVVLSDIKVDHWDQYEYVTSLLWSEELDKLLHGLCSGVIMPLLNIDECRLKCGYKALVGLSYGKPVFTDNIGFNEDLIERIHGVYNFNDLLNSLLTVDNIILPEEFSQAKFKLKYYELLQNFQTT